MRIGHPILPLILLILIATPLPAGQITDDKLRFSVAVPDGFQRDAQLASANPDFIHAFRKPAASGGVDTLIILERMRGTIGRHPLDSSRIPPNFKGRVLTLRWQTFEIDGMEVREEINGKPIINYNAQVPLKPEAIQIRVIGPAGEAPGLLAMLEQILANLTGESNWLAATPTTPTAVAGSSHYGTVILIVTLLGVATGIVLLWLLRRRSHRGTVLLVAVLIYVASWAMPDNTRETRAAVGAVRMIGFAGLLIGLFDIIHHPDSKRAVRPPPLPPEIPHQ